MSRHDQWRRGWIEAGVVALCLGALLGCAKHSPSPLPGPAQPDSPSRETPAPPASEQRESATETEEPEATLTVFCEPALEPGLQATVAAFRKDTGCEVRLEFAGSEVLLARLSQQSGGDLLMLVDWDALRAAAEGGKLVSKAPLCRVPLALLVADGNPKKLAGVRDLTRKGLRVGLASPKACSLGQASDALLARHGLTRARLGDRLTFTAMSGEELAWQVGRGKCDAALVWEPLARAHWKTTDFVELPEGQRTAVTAGCGLLADAAHPELAKRLVQMLVGAGGRRAFEAAHYLPPPV